MLLGVLRADIADCDVFGWCVLSGSGFVEYCVFGLVDLCGFCLI